MAHPEIDDEWDPFVDYLTTDQPGLIITEQESRTA